MDTTFSEKKITQTINEFLSGLTISLLLIPESIAFAFILGLSPETGIHNTMVISLINSIFGGIPTMISGSTAAVATSIVGVKTLLGNEYILPTVIFGGILQIIASFTGVYKYVSQIPKYIMSGFLVALAGLIAKNQLEDFKDKNHKYFTGIKMANTILFSIISLVIAVYGTIKKDVSIGPGNSKSIIHIPGGLISILAITSFIYLFSKYYDLVKVKDAGEVKPTIPSIHIPKVDLSIKNLIKIIPFSFAMAFAGLTESLIMLKQTEDKLHIKGDAFKESLSQGVANIVSGFTGGFGGCVLVGQSKLNLDNGSVTRFSSIITSILFIMLTLFLSSPINQIPIPAIIGIMILIAYKTGDWNSIFKPQAFDKRWFVTIITTAVGFLSGNLSFGVIAGLILNKLIF
jgi:SulP family sulfate permease